MSGISLLSRNYTLEPVNDLFIFTLKQLIQFFSAEGGEGAKKLIHNSLPLSAENYTILNMALSSLTAADYLNSARLRTLVMKNLGTRTETCIFKLIF